MPTGPGLYSRLVAILKVSLPLVALGLLASLFLISSEDGFEGGLEFSEADLEALGSGLRVTRPSFTGSSAAGDRFRFTADLVVPDAAPPSRAAVSALTGSVDFADGRSLDLSAETAEIDLGAQAMVLEGQVSVETSDGYRITAPHMEVDMTTATLAASGGVDATGPMGSISSETMTIAPSAEDEEARRIAFGDGVRLLYDPRDD